MRTGPAIVVQRGDLVIAGGCGPLENLIRCSFANELLAGEPENFTHIGIGFGAQRNCSCRNEQNFFGVRRDNDRFLSGPTGQLATSLRQKGRRDSAWNAGLLEQREKIAGPEFVDFEFPCGKEWPAPNDAGNYAGPGAERQRCPLEASGLIR